MPTCFLPRPRPAVWLAALWVLPLSAVAQVPTITGLSPVRNAVAAPRAAPVALTFSQAMAGATAGNVRVFSAQRGGQLVRGGNATVSGTTLTVDPATDFKPGETVFVTVPNTVLGASGQAAAAPHVYQFTAAVGGTGTGTFVVPATNPDPSVGNSPYSVTMGDIDGDGDLDLLTGNLSATTVSVRLNGGDASGSNTGVFSSGSDPRVLGVVTNVTLGDVDSDGDLDLIALDPGNHVSVRLNGGDASGSHTGLFSNGSNLTVQFALSDLTVGDVDGDGDLDLLVSNEGTMGEGVLVSVLFNDGLGAFSQGVDAEVGIGPSSVAVGDLDGDGDLDLLTAGPNTNTVSVRFNDGTGIFSGGTDLSVGRFPCRVVLGDVDGDGDLDLLTANSDDNTVSVRFNDGAGTFSGGTDPSVGSLPTGITLGDVDGDSDLDLFTANHGHGIGNTVSIRLNDGSGTFSGGSEVSVGSGVYDVTVGDLDGDGDLDLLAACLYGNTVSVRLNGGTGPTGLPILDVPAAFTLAPNPARTQVRIGGVEASQPITLLDATGRVVRTLTAATFSVAGLRPGLYVVRAGAQARRLVVE